MRKFLEAYFLRLEDGRSVNYPHGRFGRGYCLSAAAMGVLLKRRFRTATILVVLLLTPWSFLFSPFDVKYLHQIFFVGAAAIVLGYNQRLITITLRTAEGRPKRFKSSDLKTIQAQIFEDNAAFWGFCAFYFVLLFGIFMQF